MDPSGSDSDFLMLDLPDATALPEGLRRQAARFLLRWGRSAEALPLLPAQDRGPRDRFDRCRALLGAGRLEEARDLARELVNEPDAGPWGHRAVGEVFLAMGKVDRADERFRAGDDPLGRARAWLLLEDPARALLFVNEMPPDDPEAERIRREALRRLGQDTTALERRIGDFLEEELAELREALGEADEWAGQDWATVEDEALREALRKVYGYPDFRPGQLDVIRPLLRGQSVLGLMPTGAGKSICFQLPAALLPGATVVISPLIALMKDQVDGLPPRLYRRATLINSSLDPGEADRRMELIARGEVSLVYAAPERLRQRSFVRALQRRGVSLFVIDEAHCVSLWGHDFRPDYFFIREVLKDLGRPTVLALTATATPEMQADIGRQLDVELHRVNLGTFRPNLQFAALKLSGDGEKWSALLALAREEKGPVIVYVDRRKLAEELAEKLRAEGIAAEGYHAGMDRDVRDRVQTRFMLGEVRVMTATVAFGMGVDKADVRLVVHYNLSRSLEAYYQEAGRAGRDGLPARCVLLYTSWDKGNLTRRTGQDRLLAKEVLTLWRVLKRRLNGRMAPVQVEELERDTGMDGIRIRVGISLLQQIGVLDRGYDLPGAVWVAPGRGANGRASEAFRRFGAATNLAPGGPAVTLPIERAAAAAGLAVEAVEPALLDWQEAGWVRYRSNGRGMGVRAGRSSADPEREISAALRRMEDMDARRLEILGRYLDSSACRPAVIADYFGKPLAAGCGICDNCARGERVQERSRPAYAADGELDEAESHLFELLRAWRRERAKQDGIPAYVILHDRVLYAIARLRPRELSELTQIPGVGRAKIQTYGDEVLSVVRQAC